MMERGPIDKHADHRESSSPACETWVEKMAAAEEGTLQPDEAAAFAGHIATCSRCATLFQAAHQGSQWLALADRRPPVPAGLLESILAQTGPGAKNEVRDRRAATAGAVLPAAPSTHAIQDSVPYRPAYTRGLLTAAMAIFSIALTLNLASGRLLRKPDTTAVTTQLRSTGGLVAGYYAGFSKAQISMIDQIRSVFDDLKHPAQNKNSNPLDPSL